MKIGIDVTLLQIREGRHGIGSYLRGLLPQLRGAGAGHDFVLLAYRDRSADVESLAERFEVFPLPAPPVGRARALVSHQLVLPWTARRRRLDLVHVPGVSVNASMPAIPLWQPVPIVVTVHDLTPLRFPADVLPSFRHRAFYRGMLWAVRRARHLICDSRATRDDVIAALEIPAPRITVAPLAPDPSFGPIPGVPEDPRALDLQSLTYVLHVGGPAPVKNLGRVLTAMADLWDRHAMDVHLVCVSSLPCDPVAVWPGAAAHRARIHALDRVGLPFLRWLYQRARCLVFPSLYEGFGLPVLEAMACGCPVIASAVASLPEVGGYAAIYIDPLDTAGIASALAKLIDNPARREMARRAGLEQARRFRYEDTARATVAAYETAGRAS